MLIGTLATLAIAGVAWFVGSLVPVLGAPLLAILLGMGLSLLLDKQKSRIKPGADYASKKLLQYAIILLGFGLNLSLLLETGQVALLVIMAVIAAGLLTAFIMQKLVKLPNRMATLIGVGSAICGGSAIAATAPIIDADEDEVATAISVVVFFNVLAVFAFPVIGQALSLTSEQFGIFAGSAINDTSSVTAAASIWDTTHGLGATTLGVAVTVKLIRTLAIIPVTLALSLRTNQDGPKSKFAAIPKFILWFVAASVIATLVPLPPLFIEWARLASRFLIVMAMAAIGLKTNLIGLIKTSPKPLLLGLTCSLTIMASSLIMINLIAG